MQHLVLRELSFFFGRGWPILAYNMYAYHDSEGSSFYGALPVERLSSLVGYALVPTYLVEKESCET